MDFQLKDKVALITGSSRGIGKAAALALGKEGAKVSLCARGAGPLEQARTECHSLGIDALATTCDVTVPGEIEKVVQQTLSHFKHLHVLVCNVGGTFGGNFDQATTEDFTQTYALNVGHAVRAIQAAVPIFESNGGGTIVIVSSISGLRPGPRAQYGAAKAALIAMTASLQLELADKNIRLNCVSPGSILFEGGRWHARQQQMPERIASFVSAEFPFGRMGTLDEVANVITFLASDKSSWIAGANIVVDGAQGRPSVFLR
jgi:3-oxoacyl-[acyl-carrier protein] reductase